MLVGWEFLDMLVIILSGRWAVVHVVLLGVLVCVVSPVVVVLAMVIPRVVVPCASCLGFVLTLAIALFAFLFLCQRL